MKSGSNSQITKITIHHLLMHHGPERMLQNGQGSINQRSKYFEKIDNYPLHNTARRADVRISLEPYIGRISIDNFSRNSE